MQITRQAEYAVRTVLYLAKQEPGSCVSTARIAKEQDIPTPFLAKIILQLSAVGLLHTTRGAKGGVKLAKPSTEISMLEVIEAVDGVIELNDCVLQAARCQRSRDCPVRRTWCEARADLVKRLSRAKFGQLASNGHLPPELES
jgi:Rrf2 family protein